MILREIVTQVLLIKTVEISKSFPPLKNLSAMPGPMFEWVIVNPSEYYGVFLVVLVCEMTIKAITNFISIQSPLPEYEVKTIMMIMSEKYKLVM